MVKIFAIILLFAAGVGALTAVRALQYGLPQPNVESAQLLDFDQDHSARLLAEALAIPTISYAPGAPLEGVEFDRFAAYLERNFPLVHEAMEVETFNGFSRLYRWSGTSDDRKPVLFSAHMDVVPVEPGTESDWEYDPFAGVVADGFIWGRGALDMKNSLVGYMIAAERLIEAGFTPDRTIYFAFTHDEEVGSQAAKAIAEALQTRGVELEFTLDEGLVVTNGIVPGIDAPLALIGLAEKGLVGIEIAGSDHGGHSSVPHDNALNERLARALVDVMGAPFDARLQAPSDQLFEYIGTELPFAMRLALANRWLAEPLLLRRLTSTPATNAIVRTTVAPTMMQSGFKSNAMPQSGRVVLNVRILPGETVQGVVDAVTKAVDDETLTVGIIGSEPSGPSSVSDVSSESFAQLRKAFHQAFPDALSAPALLVGRTDSRRYANIAEQSYRFLPSRLTSEDIERIHGSNERISVENFAEIVRFYARFIELSGGPK